MSETVDTSEQAPRMHGPVTDERIASALDTLRRRTRGHRTEAILLLEAIQYERQMVREVARLAASPRRDWIEEMLRENKQPGVFDLDDSPLV